MTILTTLTTAVMSPLTFVPMPAAMATQPGLTWSPMGALTGLAFAAGVLLVWHRTPVRRRSGIEERVAPYLRDLPGDRVAIAFDPAPTARNWRAAGRAAIPRWADRLDRALGGSASVTRRLVRAGLPMPAQQFRAEQVVWGILGGFAGLLVGALAWLRRDTAAVLPAIVPLVGVVAGVAGRDWLLSDTVRRRERRMVTELPVVADLLALSLSAGEGSASALERVCRLCRGELSRELATALAQTRTGTPIATALQGVADRTGLVALVRFIDGIVIALERGTPLAEVVRAQAQDVREETRRGVIEAAGRKEIAMLVPVVFLILPVTVVFALFPGFAALSLSW